MRIDQRDDQERREAARESSENNFSPYYERASRTSVGLGQVPLAAGTGGHSGDQQPVHNDNTIHSLSRVQDLFTHRFIPADEPGAATLLALHGTGGDEQDLLPLAGAIDEHAAILSPRGRVLENGMPRFFRRLAEGVFDLADLRAQTDALAEFVRECAGTYGFNAARVFAVGYSNGANIAASLLLSTPDVLAGGMLFRPMVPFEPAAVPDLSGKQIFMSAGRQDPLIPARLTRRLAELLEAGGASVQIQWQASGHALTPADVAAARHWWVQTVRAAAADPERR